jgi:hypothetical protein
MLPKTTPVPPFASAPIAARLLGFDPPSGFGRHLRKCPDLFPNSTPRRFAIVDINAHPNREGRPVTAGEYLRIDYSLADDRAIWRSRNARRKAGTLVPGRSQWIKKAQTDVTA